MCQHFLLWAGYLSFDKSDWLCLTFLPLIPASFITPEALWPFAHPRLLVGSIYCCAALMCVCYVYVCVRTWVCMWWLAIWTSLQLGTYPLTLWPDSPIPVKWQAMFGDRDKLLVQSVLSYLRKCSLLGGGIYYSTPQLILTRQGKVCGVVWLCLCD